MSSRLMVLPATDTARIKVVSIPDDIQEQEAFRHATGIISQVEESNPDYSWEDIEDALEAHGFTLLDFQLGPSID